MDVVKVFTCEVCKQTFKTKRNMRRHLVIHTCEKSYECDICGKAFRRKFDWKRHTRIHKGEKPYVCVICEKAFRSSGSLAEHNRIHTGEKPYECDICRMTFSYSSSLAVHKRVHTGEKPYSCDVCQKSYTQSSALSKHNKSKAHIERIKSKNIDNSPTQSNFIDCGETVKVEDIKEEMNEEESVDDPLSIQKEKASDESENIVTEVKEEGIRDDLHLSDQDNIMKGIV